METDTRYRVMEETKTDKTIIADNLSYLTALDPLSKISAQFPERRFYMEPSSNIVNLHIQVGNIPNLKDGRTFDQSTKTTYHLLDMRMMDELLKQMNINALQIGDQLEIQIKINRK
ncbi:MULTISPECIES: hypothetical protein [Bacillus]|uniref:Uncharacterized protein n=3 Tax=Bacillus thuringiensis TaxID=1428 RepID=A0AAP4V398_BACTU|nr:MULTISPECIES: hypothetical protein [Bacillus]ERI01177.1 hypothetical protein BTCBT_002732 [Bacillus thuringiensis T01-328]MEC0046283.1 hypothetical protein [Bacillus cereus]AFV21647.1 hypothetical protein BTB_502p03420 [Bacillus thuringiensis Bt407]EEM25324.1 hypothetical protein bthur0002_59660 [Bacillus thuringiensis Bt407]MBN6707930.1 hypothetical protein [Bacillus thuringiensis]